MCEKSNYVFTFNIFCLNSNVFKVQKSSGGKVVILIQDVVTRWNSTLAMVERLTQHKDNILQTLKSHKHKLQLPAEAEWEKLVKIKQLLAPCKEITKFHDQLSYLYYTI